MGTLNRRAARGAPCSNVLFVILLCTPALALQPCIKAQGQQAAAVGLVSDCSWTGAGSGAVLVLGALGGTLMGPPAVKAPSGAASGTGPGSADLVHVILDGFTLPNPSSGQGLVPAGLLGIAKGPHFLSLQDVRILVDQPTLQKHVDHFAKLANVTTYTDGQSFLHVNYYSTGSVSWKSVGLLLASSLDDARSTAQLHELPPSSRTQTRSGFVSLQGSNSRISSSTVDSANSSSRNPHRRVLLAARAGKGAEGVQESGPAYNYVLAANQESLVGHLQRLGAAAGPTGCLIYLESNVTLSKPPVPASGIPVARPMAIVGLSRWVTSIDWYMQVNQLLLNYTWSNITFDSVATENLGVGDAKSAEIARPLSVSSANNFWALFYNRSQDRLLLKNVTNIFGSQEDLDYYMFWATVFHSKLPYFKAQAAFIHNTIRISVWKVGWQTDTSIQVIKCISASCRVIDSTFQLDTVVAPRMPLPRLSPELQLRPSEKSSLVTAVGDAEMFKEHLQPLSGSESGRAHVLLLRSDISLQPLFSARPNANNSVSANNSNAGGVAAAVAAGAYVPPGFPLAGIQVSAPLSIVGDLSNNLNDVSHTDTVLDLSFARGLLDVSGQGGGKGSQLQVQHLRLRGLAQGPGAAGASSLQLPDSWTLLGWAFRRSAADAVVLSGCTLELPPAEFDRLAQLANTGGGQVVLKLSGDVRTSPGDGLVVLTGVMENTPASTGRRLLSRFSSRTSSNGSRRQLLAHDSKALWVESLSAQGLSGTKLVLVPSEAATDAPWGYHWPGGAAPVAAGGMSRSALAAAIAVPVVVGVALAATAAFVVVSRRRKHRLQLDKTASATGLVGPLGSGSSAGCSSGPAYDGKCLGYVAPSSRCCSIDEGHPRGSGSGDAAVAVSSLRCSIDAAAGQDQVCMHVLASGGVKGTPGVAASGSAGSSAQGATGATGDSARSLDKTGAAQQAELPGLSHRLTSAISHLQHDITRRRIGGPTVGEKRGSSGGRTCLPGSEGAASEGGSGRAGSDGEQQPQQSTVTSSERGVCSLVASRSPVMAESAAAIVGGAAPAELQIITMIGRGSFASVYRAIWRGRCVALKVVQLPAVAGGESVNDELSSALQTRERMAVMEAVVSVTMSHPNVVQVYTFALQPLFQGGPTVTQQDAVSTPSSSSQQPAGWELQLIMEYCEEGSLRGALNQQRLVDPSSPYRLPAVHLVLALAHDVACAMLHLHSEQIVHSDLKASNVLLTKANTFAPFTAALGDSAYDASSGSMAQPGPDSCAVLLATAQALAGGRLVAKVADFGLSFALDPESTHISHMHAGTLTHMAPELLLHGRASKASDVYAFGILLWELATGLRAFQGMPVALVGHNVTQLGLRPPWIPGVSPALKQLIEQCWAQDPDDRPPFPHVLLRLEQMLQQSPEELCPPPPPSAALSSTAQLSTQQQQQQQQPWSPTDEHLMQQWRQLQLERQQQKERQRQLQQATAGESEAGPDGAAAAAAGAAAGHAAAADVTGDWTM